MKSSSFVWSSVESGEALTLVSAWLPLPFPLGTSPPPLPGDLISCLITLLTGKMDLFLTPAMSVTHVLSSLSEHDLNLNPFLNNSIRKGCVLDLCWDKPLHAQSVIPGTVRPPSWEEHLRTVPGLGLNGETSNHREESWLGSSLPLPTDHRWIPPPARYVLSLWPFLSLPLELC